MSQSYKKYPCWSAPDSRQGVHSGVHDSKRLANRKARRTHYWDTPSGSKYKHITDSWDIRDYKSVIHTRQEVLFQIAQNKRLLEGGYYPHERRYGMYRRGCIKSSQLYYYYSK